MHIHAYAYTCQVCGGVILAMLIGIYKTKTISGLLHYIISYMTQPIARARSIHTQHTMLMYIAIYIPVANVDGKV